MNARTGSTHRHSGIGSLLRRVVDAHQRQTDVWERVLSCPRSTRPGRIG